MLTGIRAALCTTAIAVVMLALPNTPALGTGGCGAINGQQRVAVLELCTSKGCDGCPPKHSHLHA
jgi:hypothetical protein